MGVIAHGGADKVNKFRMQTREEGRGEQTIQTFVDTIYGNPVTMEREKEALLSVVDAAIGYPTMGIYRVVSTRE